MLSAQRVAQSILPPTQTSMEFELMMRHPISYPTLVPAEAAHVDLEQLLSPSVSLSGSRPGTEMYGLPPTLSYICWKGPDVRDRRRPADVSGVTSGDLPPVYCDERLRKLDISKWTRVSVSNDFAARAISLYLETDHPVLGLFDADLFLDNLVTVKLAFCSPLLTSALLAWACEAYSYFEPEAAALSYLFYDEAKALWQAELENNPDKPTLTAVAASQLLSIAASCHGNDIDALALLREGCEVGVKMGLFGVPKEKSAEIWVDHVPEWIRATTHTAWGVFSWVTFRSLHFHRGQIESPPCLPRPGDRRSWDGIHWSVGSEKGIQSDKNQYHSLLPFMGGAFTEMCGLWVIAHEIIWAYYDGSDFVAPTNRAHIEHAQELYLKLLHWADNLPIGLVRGDQMPHHVAIAHIYYHAVVIDLFRPFVGGPQRNYRLAGFSSEQSTPAAVYAASVNQLKRLVLLYRTRYPSAHFTFLWHTALLYVANAMISADPAEEGDPGSLLVWFRLCLAGYLDLLPSFRVVEGIVQGLLSMAMRKGIMSATEATEARASLHRKSAARKLPSHIGRPDTGFKPECMLDLHLAMKDPLAARAETVAQQFNELVMFLEFTNVEDKDYEEEHGDYQGHEGSEGYGGHGYETGRSHDKGKGKERMDYRSQQGPSTGSWTNTGDEEEEEEEDDEEDIQGVTGQAADVMADGLDERMEGMEVMVDGVDERVEEDEIGD
ncbi:hypothetical protein QBC46DRAFT_325783 [Diplogelasinospora grovesii]|uniref:Transcription factor domain-containing protein n=1 Tax=Diplogelasinospora grovesii TaxID=303347 RepID=A0AAN6RXY6_9PEZI|nr:hypothetical protein QBC46DRAFT_325783 [Diplogelasinospora grovesii]